MAADEEKKTAGPEEAGTGAEKKERKYWPLALGLTFAVLAGGAYYAATGLSDTAHKLGGGEDYAKLAADNVVYSGKSQGRPGDVFAVSGQASSSQAADSSPSALNPALVPAQGELAAAADGSSAAGGGAARQGGASGDAAAAQPGPRAAGGGAGLSMAGRLKTTVSLSRGGGAAVSRSSGLGAASVFAQNGTAVGRASAQSQTASASLKKGGRGGVLEALKGAFVASLYGARLASNDAAKAWVSKAFDATPDAEESIAYGDQVRTQLDKVNPSSIPRFLKEQDLSAGGAKTLASSAVSEPKMDKTDTDAALNEDKAYQREKMMKDLSSSMINSIFAGVSGSGDGSAPKTKTVDDGTGGTQTYSLFASPEDQQTYSDMQLQQYVDAYGYGGECGCTQDAPCCCLQSTGAGAAGSGALADFPSGN